MRLPKQRIQVVAAEPIVVGEGRRILPSVLVTKTAFGDPASGGCQWISMRPVSFVEEGPEGSRWHEIPDVTTQTLSVMLVTGLGVALIALMVVGLLQVLRRSAGE